MKSFAELDDSSIDDQFAMIQKRKTIAIISDFLCNMIEYIAFIPTLVYNIFWITYINSLLSTTPLSSVDLSGNNVGNSCIDLIRWKNHLLTWTKVSLSKAFLFLCTSKICCGNENDLNIFCVFLKSVTSLVPSLVFTFKLPDVIKEYTEIKKIIYHQETLNRCDSLENALSVYQKFEKMYCFLIGGLFAFVVFGTIMAALKEVWRSRGYRVR